jgi:hypothetical protein
VTYQISRDGSIIGTFTHLEVMKGLMDGTFLTTDHYWKAGMAGWKSLGEFRQNEQSQSSTPPPAVSVNNTISTKTKIIKVLWVIFAVFMPYFGAWRIIFDKSLGFSKKVKIGFTTYIILLFVIGFIGIRSGHDIAPTNSVGSQSALIEHELRVANALIYSESIDDRQKGFKVILESGTKGEIHSQATLIDIYKTGMIDGKPSLIDMYAWVKILATTHRVDPRGIKGRVSQAAEDAQWELDEYERKHVIISKQKQLQLASTIISGVEFDRITVDGIIDVGGKGVASINSAKSSLEKLKQQMSPAQIEAGEKRSRELQRQIEANNAGN